MDYFEPIVLSEVEEDALEPPLEEEQPLIIPSHPFDEVQEEAYSLEDEVPVVEEILSDDNITNNTLEESISAHVITETVKIDKPKKIKNTINMKNILRYLFLPFEVISYPVYKIFKYVLLGLMYSSNLIYKVY